MSFKVVDVVSDTPEWLEERRNSVGASEVAAVMGLSPWQTPLDIYKSKMGADSDFNEDLAWVGHRSEAIVADWIMERSGLGLKLEPAGFMARHEVLPIHASFDRVQTDPFLTVQIKTAHQYSGHKWDEGIPTDIRVQVQAEMFVAGTLKALVVVWIGGREFRPFWELRDDAFITEHMIPAVESFWVNVQREVAPLPRSLAEINDVWPSESAEIEATEDVFDLLGQRAVLLADVKDAEEEAEALKMQIALFMQTADTLTWKGKRVLTFKTQRGRQTFNAAEFKEAHPDLAAQFTRQGADFKVMRTMKGALDD